MVVMTGCGRGGDTQPNASITNHVPDGAARSELVLVRSVFSIGVRLVGVMLSKFVERR